MWIWVRGQARYLSLTVTEDPHPQYGIFTSVRGRISMSNYVVTNENEMNGVLGHFCAHIG